MGLGGGQKSVSTELATSDLTVFAVQLLCARHGSEHLWVSTSDDVEATLRRETIGKHAGAAVGNRVAQVCVGQGRHRAQALADCPG